MRTQIRWLLASIRRRRVLPKRPGRRVTGAIFVRHPSVTIALHFTKASDNAPKIKLLRRTPMDLETCTRGGHDDLFAVCILGCLFDPASPFAAAAVARCDHARPAA